MAKFRKNHTRADKSGFGGMLRRVLMFFGLAIAGFVYIYNTMNDTNWDKGRSRNDQSVYTQEAGSETFEAESTDRDYIPKGSSGAIIHHDYFIIPNNEYL